MSYLHAWHSNDGLFIFVVMLFVRSVVSARFIYILIFFFCMFPFLYFYKKKKKKKHNINVSYLNKKKKNVCHTTHFEIYSFTRLALLKSSFGVPNFHLWSFLSRKNYYGKSINILLYIPSTIRKKLLKHLQTTTLVTLFWCVCNYRKKKIIWYKNKKNILNKNTKHKNTKTSENQK